MDDGRIIVALDDIELESALTLAEKLHNVPGIWGVKVNSLLRMCGYPLIRELKDRGMRVMADLKLHDIPNTVANDCKWLASFGPHIVTGHGSGGGEMMQMAVDALGADCMFAAISVLTSLSPEAAEEIFARPIQDEVAKLATIACENGAGGIVCSVHELPMLQALKGCASTLKRITPGIRPRWYEPADDQSRIATPAGAIEAGADYLVIGRPILKAANPVEAAKWTVDEVMQALAASAS